MEGPFDERVPLVSFTCFLALQNLEGATSWEACTVRCLDQRELLPATLFSFSTYSTTAKSICKNHCFG